MFSWSALEPQEGVFALDWLADIIHSLYDNGISTILATPSAARPVDGATLPETQAFVLCEVAALQDTDPTTLLSVYTEDYFAGCPAVAIHSYGAGRAYYLASRFDAAFYRAFYRNAAQETGLTPAWPEALPDGVLAARRGAFVFVQNCNEHPVEVGGVALNRYGTAVWKNGEQIL